MSLSLSIHLIEGCPAQAGAKSLPIALAVHTTEPLVIAKNAMVTGLWLERDGVGTEIGWACEIPWFPSVEQIKLTPEQAFFLVADLVAQDDDQKLVPGSYVLFAKIFFFRAKGVIELGEVEEPKYEWQGLRATRNIEIA